MRIMKRTCDGPNTQNEMNGMAGHETPGLINMVDGQFWHGNLHHLRSLPGVGGSTYESDRGVAA